MGLWRDVNTARRNIDGVCGFAYGMTTAGVIVAAWGESKLWILALMVIGLAVLAGCFALDAWERRRG